MQDNRRPEPSFCDKSQAIIKYDCNGNLFNVSSLSEFYRPVDSSGFAIKFVTEGKERYTIDKQPYDIATGSYLLLNCEKEAKVEIESKKKVKGICINISPAVIADAVSSLARPDTPYSDPGLASFFYTDHFLENQYNADHTLLGDKLQRISQGIKHNTLSAGHINTELFFDIAEGLIADQTTVFKQLQSIRAVKSVTKRDLCRRLMRGREFMDACFTQSLSIEQVAQAAAMSEFHFFRLFKNMFGLSPHQYILHKRLQAASQLLKTGYSVSEAAMDCGFTDIYTFSKAFKKRFGMPPSSFARVK